MGRLKSDRLTSPANSIYIQLYKYTYIHIYQRFGHLDSCPYFRVYQSPSLAECRAESEAGRITKSGFFIVQRMSMIESVRLRPGCHTHERSGSPSQKNPNSDGWGTDHICNTSIVIVQKILPCKHISWIFVSCTNITFWCKLVPVHVGMTDTFLGLSATCPYWYD